MADNEKKDPEWVMNLPRTTDLVIATARAVFVRIKSDGTLEYGPDYNPDAAAQVFWQTVARHREQHEEQRLISQHVEALVMRLGEADLYCEMMRKRAAELLGTGTEGSAVLEAQRATSVLTTINDQVIELGRGLARRPIDVKFVDLPGRVPQVVAENAASDYDPEVLPGDAEIGPPKAVN
jgi:hypothetical protein